MSSFLRKQCAYWRSLLIQTMWQCSITIYKVIRLTILLPFFRSSCFQPSGIYCQHCRASKRIKLRKTITVAALSHFVKIFYRIHHISPIFLPTAVYLVAVSQTMKCFLCGGTRLYTESWFFQDRNDFKCFNIGKL